MAFPTPPDLDYVAILRHLGLEPDPWQLDVLLKPRPRLLLNCARQAGKSTIVALAALFHILLEPLSKVLLISRSIRQSSELFRTVVRFYDRLHRRLKVRQNATELLLANESRLICLPCNGDTIRGYSAVSLLIIDEAARVPDHLYRSVRPMLAVSNGRLICLSTPAGKRGFFYREWFKGGDDWDRIEVPVTQIPRITPEFLEAERRSLGESWFRQEYLCAFEAQEGLVYPNLRRCIVDALPPHLENVPALKPLHEQAMPRDRGDVREIDAHAVSQTGLELVGGLDFGFRNPFAAVWGVVDRDDVLWLTGEHYAAGQPLSYHAARLPRQHDFVWFADPSGAADIAELRRANICIKQGINAIREGIMAVTARINTDRLKILKGRCPNLLREADLYRYPPAGKSVRIETDDDADAPSTENPIDAHNHALGALRYLIARIDKNKQIPQAARMETAPTARREGEEDAYWERMG